MIQASPSRSKVLAAQPLRAHLSLPGLVPGPRPARLLPHVSRELKPGTPASQAVPRGPNWGPPEALHPAPLASKCFGLHRCGGGLPGEKDCRATEVLHLGQGVPKSGQRDMVGRRGCEPQVSRVEPHGVWGRASRSTFPQERRGYQGLHCWLSCEGDIHPAGQRDPQCKRVMGPMGPGKAPSARG